ncbi:MAG: flagellar hook-length control protein FliK [Methylophilaceae bacterium]
MDKSSNLMSVKPLAKISPLTAVAGIGQAAQELESRAENLAKQQAGLVAKMAEMTLKGPLGNTVSTANVSDTAKFIDQTLKQAAANGISEKFMAQQVISHRPHNPEIVAQQLKAAISNSGLFYESHLKAFVEGHRHLNAIKQEPQNNLHQNPQSILPQQLHILEHQRLSWHGEVWPNQTMDWEVYLHNEQDDNERWQAEPDETAAIIASDLTLHLPHLGKVSAKISIKNGRMQVGIVAEEHTSLALLKANKPSLVSAMTRHGQQLDQLTVTAND